MFPCSVAILSLLSLPGLPGLLPLCCYSSIVLLFLVRSHYSAHFLTPASYRTISSISSLFAEGLFLLLPHTRKNPRALSRAPVHTHVLIYALSCTSCSNSFPFFTHVLHSHYALRHVRACTPSHTHTHTIPLPILLLFPRTILYRYDVRIDKRGKTRR